MATMSAHLPFPATAFVPLDDFSLLWRWTSPTHAVFPPEVMAQIRPFTPSVASTLNAEALVRVPSPYGAGDDSVKCGETVPEEGITNWLMSVSATSSAWTVLSWNRELAVLLPWNVFARRWSDFCYPSSDDMYIWQPGQDWTLAYEHRESFQYFRHRAVRVV